MMSRGISFLLPNTNQFKLGEEIMKEIQTLIEEFAIACKDITEIKKLLMRQGENQQHVSIMPQTKSMQEIEESMKEPLKDKDSVNKDTNPNPFDRKAVKARLDELKILYQPRAKTATLVRLLNSVVRIDELTLEELKVKLDSLKVMYRPDWNIEVLATLFKGALSGNVRISEDLEKSPSTPEQNTLDQVSGVSEPEVKSVEEVHAQKELDQHARDLQFLEGDSEPEAKPVEEPQAQKEPDQVAGEPQETLEIPNLDAFTHMLKSWAVQNGTDKVRKMLADCNVARISELSDEQRAVIWKQCNA